MGYYYAQWPSLYILFMPIYWNDNIPTLVLRE